MVFCFWTGWWWWFVLLFSLGGGVFLRGDGDVLKKKRIVLKVVGAGRLNQMYRIVSLSIGSPYDRFTQYTVMCYQPRGSANALMTLVWEIQAYMSLYKYDVFEYIHYIYSFVLTPGIPYIHQSVTVCWVWQSLAAETILYLTNISGMYECVLPLKIFFYWMGIRPLRVFDSQTQISIGLLTVWA